MLTKRRAVMSGIVAMGLSKACAEGIIIQPVSPTSGKSDLYSVLANIGPFGIPPGALLYELSHGVRVNIFIPPQAREARLVIFSHGELGAPETYTNLLSHWASHGFIVIAPLHQDSLLRNGMDAIQRDDKGQVLWDVHSVLNDPKAWDERVTACRTVIDSISMIEQATRIRILDDRIILAGHSFGAFAAQLMLGVEAVSPKGERYSNKDERIYAGLLLSPQGRGIFGLTDDSWQNVQRPFMMISGNGDTDSTGQDPNTKIEGFALSPPGNRHLAWFTRIIPTIYPGQRVTAKTLTETVFADMKSVTTAFLTAYGKYDTDVFAKLSGSYYAEATENRLLMQYR